MKDDLERYEATLQTIAHLLDDLTDRMARHPEGIADTLERDKSIDAKSTLRIDTDTAGGLGHLAEKIRAANTSATRAQNLVGEALKSLNRAAYEGMARARQEADDKAKTP